MGAPPFINAQNMVKIPSENMWFRLSDDVLLFQHDLGVMKNGVYGFNQFSTLSKVYGTFYDT